MPVRDDIEQQKAYDTRRAMNEDVLRARYQGTLQALDALLAEESGARWALRQSLIDLASCAELMAAEMPTPRR